jgi:dTDP-4-dehydrorhamnose reductase
MILITGGSGQLGQELQKGCTARGWAFTAVSRPAFDFERPETINACFAAASPTVVINAAAYTAVDAAESNIAAATAGNHTGPLRLAELCAAADIPFIHVSTDYVFDGAKGAPYLETDSTCPTGVYGTTKRDGEEAILATDAKAIILRTAWVYAAHGKNFARTMLNASRKTSQLRVVADQRGTPTAAGDLANVILQIVAVLQQGGWQNTYKGLFHATGSGETTWHGFAEAIFAAAAPLGLTRPIVTPIATKDWPTPAKRPADSRLNCEKISKIFGISLPDWEKTLPGIVAEVLETESQPPHV